MVTRRLFATPVHQHADPARRIMGVAELPPDSDDLAALLVADPAGGARRSQAVAPISTLAAACESGGSAVRAALAASMVDVLSARRTFA
jgi:hypothetical protein